MNEGAWQRLQSVLQFKEELGLGITTLEGGSLLVDAGVNVPGGMEAGLVMARLGTGDLAGVKIEMADLIGTPWPFVVVRSDHPLEACYLSQAAHWPVQVGDFHAMGSGPACLLNPELEPGKSLKEQCHQAVLVLETRQLPDNVVSLELARQCCVEPEGLSMVVAPTSSLAGSVQIAARSVETALHKLHTLGFDLGMVAAGLGRCPIAAPTGSDLTALGRTNDMVMYACQVWLSIRGASDSELKKLADTLPASKSSSYGPPFLDALKQAGGFYQLDPGLFAPAEITLTNLDSGRVFHAGSIDRPRLEKVLQG